MRVTKKEIIIGVSALILGAALVGGGVWWRSDHHKTKQLSAASGTTSDPNISLDQDNAGDNSGGLSVSDQASDPGQLNGNQSQNGQNSGGSGDSSGGNIDPSKLAQYEKYKNNKSALFADIQKGTGAALISGKQANVTYKGWLTNGALIDQSPVSSNGQPQPFNFKMGAHQVITGWEEGLYGMKAGGARLIIVPPAVGYGDQAHGSVPANALLLFEVHLISVK
jgi:FKBP-type peptidyl-prolyl cis-trans isomerase